MFAQNLIKDTDYFIGTHRAHGHYLAYGGSAKKLLLELMGKDGALCFGRGGTQHTFYKNFFQMAFKAHLLLLVLDWDFH